jgi:hypothetical protein
MLLATLSFQKEFGIESFRGFPQFDSVAVMPLSITTSSCERYEIYKRGLVHTYGTLTG